MQATDLNASKSTGFGPTRSFIQSKKRNQNSHLGETYDFPT